MKDKLQGQRNYEWQRKVKYENSGTAGDKVRFDKHYVCYIMILLQRQRGPR